MNLLSQQHVEIEKRLVNWRGKCAALTLDLEADYGGHSFEATQRIADLWTVLKDFGLPLTVFVEGRVLEKFPDLIVKIARDGVDVHLHCYDHTVITGDTAESLRRSVKLFETVLGKKPEGYRAHTFQLNPPLFEALCQNEFLWDSSILPAAFGYGANKDKAWQNDGKSFYKLQSHQNKNSTLISFPVATYQKLTAPLNFSYRSLLRHYPASAIDKILGLPEFLIFDMHMTDLIFSSALKNSPSIPASARFLYQLNWLWRDRNLFPALTGFAEKLRRLDYQFATMTDIFHHVTTKTGEA